MCDTKLPHDNTGRCRACACDGATEAIGLCQVFGVLRTVTRGAMSL